MWPIQNWQLISCIAHNVVRPLIVAPGLPSLQAMHVLVVEDDIETARYLQKGLTESGHVVELVHDGADGLALALDHRFDALVVDRMLPGLDGLALIETLRRRAGARRCSS